jgi:hypothetical protein
VILVEVADCHCRAQSLVNRGLYVGDAHHAIILEVARTGSTPPTGAWVPESYPVSAAGSSGWPVALASDSSTFAWCPVPM